MKKNRMTIILVDLLEKVSEDGFMPCYQIPNVYSGEIRKDIADDLVRLGCLRNDWSACGKNGIQGYFDTEAIKKLLAEIQ